MLLKTVGALFVFLCQAEGFSSGDGSGDEGSAEMLSAIGQLKELRDFGLHLVNTLYKPKHESKIKKNTRKFEKLYSDMKHQYEYCMDEEFYSDIEMPEMSEDRCEPIFQMTAAFNEWAQVFLWGPCQNIKSQTDRRSAKKFLRQKVDKNIKRLDKFLKNSDRKNKCPLIKA